MCTLWWSLTGMNNERRISKFIVKIRKCSSCPAPLFWKRCRYIECGSCLFTKMLSNDAFESRNQYHFETPYSPWSWMIIAMANFITLKTLFTYPWQLIKQYKHELITVATSSPLSITDLWPGPSYLTPNTRLRCLPTCLRNHALHFYYEDKVCIDIILLVKLKNWETLRNIWEIS